MLSLACKHTVINHLVSNTQDKRHPAFALLLQSR